MTSHANTGIPVKWLVLLSFLFLFACSDNDGATRELPSSGNQSMDQAARFARHLIDKVRHENRDWPPSEVVAYITSTQGSAALWPPDPQTEPGLADAYKGPRPPSPMQVAIRGDLNHPFAEQILVLRGDDSMNVVVGEAHKREGAESYFSWHW